MALWSKEGQEGQEDPEGQEGQQDQKGKRGKEDQDRARKTVSLLLARQGCRPLRRCACFSLFLFFSSSLRFFFFGSYDLRWSHVRSISHAKNQYWDGGPLLVLVLRCMHKSKKEGASTMAGGMGSERGVCEGRRGEGKKEEKRRK